MYRRHCGHLLHVAGPLVTSTDFRYDDGKTYCPNLPEKGSLLCRSHRKDTGTLDKVPEGDEDSGGDSDIADAVSDEGEQVAGLQLVSDAVSSAAESSGSLQQLSHTMPREQPPAFSTRAALRSMAGPGMVPARILMERRGNQGHLLYLIQWQGMPLSKCSYESSAIVTQADVLADWNRRRMPGSFYDGVDAASLVEAVPELNPLGVDEALFATRGAKRPRAGDEVTKGLSNAELTAAATARRAAGLDKKCSPRYTTIMRRRTAGCMYGFCACGWMYPAMEMVMNESPTTVSLWYEST